jgi:hypothetical protein
MTLPMMKQRTFVYLVAALFVLVSATSAEATPYASYFRVVPTGPGTNAILFEPGPFPEQLGGFSPDYPPLPGLDENTEGASVTEVFVPALDDATLQATIELAFRDTYIARDSIANELGRLVVLVEGTQVLDLLADNAIVDSDAGTIRVQLIASLDGEPVGTFSVIDATGMYQSEVVTAGGVYSAGGHFVLPLDDDPASSLQDNILAAFGAGQIIGADVVGVYVGEYVPEPSSATLLIISLTAILTLARRQNGEIRK